MLDLYFGHRRAHTESTKQWLNILDKENVPVLICLSFADKLFAELMGKNEDFDIEKVKDGVEKQLNVCTNCIYFSIPSANKPFYIAQFNIKSFYRV